MDIDLTKICRLCLKSVTSGTELIDIFTNDEYCSLPMRIMACSALEVNPSDALPKSICMECRYSLEKFYLFQKKSKNSDTKFRRHLWLVNAGKVSNIFQEKDDDNDEYEQSIALLAKWQKNQVTEQAVVNLICEIEQESELVELGAFREDKQIKDCANEVVFDEYFSAVPLVGLESIDNNCDTYEVIIDETNGCNLKLGDAEASENITEQDKDQNDHKSGMDISIVEAEAESEIRKEDGDDSAQLVSHHYQCSSSAEFDPVLEDNQIKDCPTEGVFDEYFSPVPLVGLESIDTYEVVIDETNDCSSTLGDAEASQNTSVSEQDQDHIDLISDMDISIVEAEAERKIRKGEGEDSAELVSHHYQCSSSADALIEFDPVLEDNQIKDCATEGVFDEYFSPVPLVGLESINNNCDTYEVIIDETNGCNLKLGDARASQNTSVRAQDQYHIDLVSDMDISIVEAEAESKIRRGEGEDCTNPEYLKIGDKSEIKNRNKENLRVKKRKKDVLCCEYCSKWFPHDSSLRRHMRTHTGERPFNCEECGATFVQKEVLTRHLMIHNDNKPHQCDVCCKKFIHRKDLTQHMNRHHATNPIIHLHKCPQCSKSFLHASGLSRHSPVHDGQMFACQFCSKTFRDKSSLKRHIRLLHSNKTPQTLLVEVLKIENRKTVTPKKSVMENK